MKMSENQVPKFPELTAEQLEKIGGGNCSIDDWVKATKDLKEAYENIVDLASHIIERVAN
jgi:regulator of sigma D